MGLIRDALGIYDVVRSRRKRPSSSSAKASPSGDQDKFNTPMDVYDRGGKVRHSGPARLKKGEHVMTAGQYRRMKRRSGKR